MSQTRTNPRSAPRPAHAPKAVNAPAPSNANRPIAAAAPTPTEADIRRRAYEIFLRRKGAAGDPALDWLEAERELTARKS